MAGQVDVLTVAQLREALLDACDSGCGDLIVDVSAVSFVDTTGLGALLSAHRRCRRAGRRLVLRDPPVELVRLLHRTRLARVIATMETVDLTEPAPRPAVVRWDRVS
jgi:anti-anti-sigma factor